MQYYYRKYMMDDLSLLNEITQSIINPDTGENDWYYTQIVHVIGQLCEVEVTASDEYGTYISCSLKTTSSAVDIIWDQEPLINFSSSEVWPEPTKELHTFGDYMFLYKEAYCERFECPSGSLPTGSLT